MNRKLDDIEILTDAIERRIDAAFREEDHPRAEDGKFGSGAGGHTENRSPPPSAAQTAREKEAGRRTEELLSKGPLSDKEVNLLYRTNRKEWQNYIIEHELRHLSPKELSTALKGEKELKAAFEAWKAAQ